MRMLPFPTLMLLSSACNGAGPLGGLDCGRFSPQDGDVLVLGQTAEGGYDAYEDVVTWAVEEQTFQIGAESFTEDVLTGRSVADVSYGGGGATHWEQESWLRCDADGVWLVGHTYASNTVYSDGQTLEVDQHTEYNVASFIRPLNPELNDTWTRVFDYTIVSSDPEIEPSPVDQDWTETVTASADITTAAGTFEALEITSDTTTAEFSSWLGVGVGFLQSDAVELTEIR